MDLKLFFDSVSADIDISKYPSNALVHSIFINSGDMPDVDGLDIAIVGLIDGRGADEKSQSGLSKAADEVRKSFYELKKSAGQFKIADLGNLRKGPDLSDTYLRIQEVGSYLLEQKVLPIFIGGAHNMDLGQYTAYEELEKLVTILSVDNKLDIDDPKRSTPSLTHNQTIFKHEPNFLFNYYQLGYQSYLIDSSSSALMEQMSFEAYRLGTVKEDIKNMEPVIRDADMLSFDISAIQAHYCPGGDDVKVYGLTGEEACQICWYAGLNDKLSSVGFYGYNVDKDSDDRKTAFVISTMLWYFIEGYYNRKGDKNFFSNDYLVYEVAIGGNPESIRFYKSKLSEKWWMEVPHPEDKVGFMRSKMIPCSYMDYEEALQGELPEKWINIYAKF
ncbi:MAG: formiminoglutamase [Cyclobacteriaceae bacterium]|jgi:formiminoglutamase